MPKHTVKFTQSVKAPVSQAYHAFTNATALREWLCDVASVHPQPEGRVYLAWNSGYYASGEYSLLEKNQRIEFKWRGRNDPADSLVQVQLNDTGEGVEIQLEHTIPDDGGAWTESLQEIEKGWKGSLENLASVLETGEDLRFTLRPMLGIILNDFNAEIAERLGVPVSEGIRLDGVVDGMGAQAAGLRQDDVLVGMAGLVIHDFPDLVAVLQGKRAGDVVEVVFYRGSEKMTTQMELSRRRIPEVPDTLEELVEKLQERWHEMEVEADAFFTGVTDVQASFKPGPDEWSIKEILAHLIQGERSHQVFLSEVLEGQERWSDDFSGNVNAYIRATVSVYPTLKELLEAYKRSNLETIALYENLPANFIDTKGGYWRVVTGALEEAYHFRAHIEQMKAALEAASEAQPVN